MSAGYRRVDLVADDWMLLGVAVATSFLERLVGIHGVATGAVMIPTRSIHTFTMRTPLRVIALDDAGRVAESVTVPPRTILTVPGASWIVESRRATDAPPVGTAVRIMASCVDARDPRRLRHTHREPR